MVPDGRDEDLNWRLRSQVCTEKLLSRLYKFCRILRNVNQFCLVCVRKLLLTVTPDSTPPATAPASKD